MSWLVLVCYEKKRLLADWFGLAETNLNVLLTLRYAGRSANLSTGLLTGAASDR